ncbi:MAG TPA: hypothetical protein VKR55_13400 [Bradyrhizobium sp.]|uniref:hypothetical protein n=1 Tax=Bradyrhizobium sp. TaxID=376 RepID=UPI002C2B4E97|nr:hypothetical protein [Bradyrhizobium sp.]HLZ03128.1 hypothetical protein [Bradyrhizobium sp.]
MEVDGDDEGGEGGGGGKVNPWRWTKFSTRSRGPPGPLCCWAVWASAKDVVTVRIAAESANDVSLIVMRPNRLNATWPSGHRGPVMIMTDQPEFFASNNRSMM